MYGPTTATSTGFWQHRTLDPAMLDTKTTNDAVPRRASHIPVQWYPTRGFRL